MTIFDHMFDNQWRQREDITGLRENRRKLDRRLEKESRRARELEERVEGLEAEVDELATFSRALLRMLVDCEVCTADEFAESFGKVAREQAQEDEEWHEDEHEAQPCPECERGLQHDNTWCVYCGYRAPESPGNHP